MKPLYSDISQVGFAFTEARQTFEHNGKTWQIMWGPFRGPQNVRIEVDAKGRLVVGPASAPALSWIIDRDVFLTAVSILKQAGVDDLRRAELIVFFPSKNPGLNFAISRTAFNHGVRLATLGLDAYNGIQATKIRPYPKTN